MGAVAEASRFFLGTVFTLAALPKLSAPLEFEQAVRGYGLIPEATAKPVAVWLPRLELVTGAALFAGVASVFAAGLLLVCLIAFSAAIAVALARGREIDCGCFAPGSSSRITPASLLRNTSLALLAVVILVEYPAAAMTTVDFSVGDASSTLALMVVGTGIALAGLLIGAARRLRRTSELLRPYAYVEGSE